MGSITPTRTIDVSLSDTFIVVFVVGLDRSPGSLSTTARNDREAAATRRPLSRIETVISVVFFSHISDTYCKPVTILIWLIYYYQRMIIESVTLVPPVADRSPITLADVRVRSVARSRHTVVLEVPASTIDEPLSTGVGTEAGSSIVVTTTDGRTYSGYVEVVAEGTDSRFYWCGLAG